MSIPTSDIDALNERADRLKRLQIIHLDADPQDEPGWRQISIKGKPLLNFACCNYLGLESDPRLREAAKEAIDRYGVQYYSVRAYVSLSPYQELEHNFSRMFGKPAVVMPSTALGHWSAIPILVGSEDAIILDHQVHSTVQNIARMVKANGTHVEMVRHNRLDYLESRIRKLSLQYKKIWYMADGVYSMYGDIAPLAGIHELLDRYEQFHLYMDDAHGMSWTGPNGTGVTLRELPFHPKMVLMTSLSKGFGCMGGLAVFPDEVAKNRVRNVGSTLIFTGPIQPPLLAAALECTKIHLSPEIYEWQDELKTRIDFMRQRADELNLPILGTGETPVFYLGLGNQEAAFSMSHRLIEAGFLPALAAYPSVPLHRSGMRLLPTLYHSLDDIAALLDTVAELLPQVLDEVGGSMDDIWKAFELQEPLPV